MAVYLKNKNLLSEFHRCKERGELTPEMTQMFILLVNRIAHKFYYQRYEDGQDAKQTALYHLVRAWHKFNPEKSDNPFAFYTQVAKMGFATGWNQLHKPGSPQFVRLDRMGANGESNYDML